MTVNNNLTKNLVNILVPILVVALVGMVGWVMTVTSDIKVLETELASLKVMVKNKTRERYTRTDADRDVGRIEEQIKDLETRLRILEHAEHE